jgi:AraC-like DNA-binding protein
LSHQDYSLTISDSALGGRVVIHKANSTPRPARGPHAPAVATVRASPLVGLAQLVRDLGHEPGPAFAREGLAPADLADPDAEISFSRAGRLLASCVSATGCRQLGLLLGQRISPSSLGIPGYLLHTARDVRAALLDLVRHFDLHDRGAVLTLDTNEVATFLGYAIYLPEVPAADQIYDLSIAAECNVMRELCGSDWSPSEVRLTRGVPEDITPYRRFFRAPIHFDADRSALVFPSRWLDHPVSSSNPMLHRHLEKEAEILHAEQPGTLVEQLRGLLRGSLATKKADAPHVARQLGLHERTLNRRLRQAGTSFRQELQGVRYQVAQELLVNTRLSLSRIAAALNYSDTSAFVRAFRQWSGMSPGDWRRRHGPR